MYNLFKYSLLLSLFILLFINCNTPAYNHIIGTAATKWNVDEWVNSDPIQLSELRGKVVLIRWWTDGCVYCENTSTALNSWNDQFAEEDFLVVGMYHPKPRPREVHPTKVSWYSQKLGFDFPIGLDNDWKLLREYWLDRVSSNWTSISFLIDKKGDIRYIHPGGEYHKSNDLEHAQCQKDYDSLESFILELINE